MARGFARYLAASDPAAEVPPTGLLDARRKRHQPFIFTGQETAVLLAEAGQHRRRLPAVTYPALFGLIAATGIRLGEALRLDDADADPGELMITIRDSKYGRSRRIPVDATVAAALLDYRQRRQALSPGPATPAPFISAGGSRLARQHDQAEFRRIAAKTGIGAKAVNPPRIHDLRHTMAVRTLAGWYRDGGDVAARMPLLSAYLGHVSPVSTYWYISGVPELLALAAQRLENAEAAS